MASQINEVSYEPNNSCPTVRRKPIHKYYAFNWRGTFPKLSCIVNQDVQKISYYVRVLIVENYVIHIPKIRVNLHVEEQVFKHQTRVHTWFTSKRNTFYMCNHYLSKNC